MSPQSKIRGSGAPQTVGPTPLCLQHNNVTRGATFSSKMYQKLFGTTRALTAVPILDLCVGLPRKGKRKRRDRVKYGEMERKERLKRKKGTGTGRLCHTVVFESRRIWCKVRSSGH